jgi:hypothetical protein
MLCLLASLDLLPSSSYIPALTLIIDKQSSLFWHSISDEQSFIILAPVFQSADPQGRARPVRKGRSRGQENFLRRQPGTK